MIMRICIIFSHSYNDSEVDASSILCSLVHRVRTSDLPKAIDRGRFDSSVCPVGGPTVFQGLRASPLLSVSLLGWPLTANPADISGEVNRVAQHH